MAITKKITGVDNNTMNKLTSTYQASDKVNQADANANQFLNKVQSSANSAANNGIVSQKYWDRINTDYQMSPNVQNAMNYTDKLLEQLSTGKTSYSDRVDEMIQNIMNREQFSYDPDTDTLFQNALASAMKSGQSAMQDTIGQASALTGGYGSSYATSAGNQAYNNFVQGAYDNLPAYYEMALNTYQMDSQDAYNKLGMLNAADDKEFGRLETAYNANFNNWTQKYDMEYNRWRDSVNIALQAAGLEMDESNAIFNRLQGAFSSSMDYSNSTYNREYGQWSDAVNNAFNLAQMENSDYWKQYSASQSAKKDAEANKVLKPLSQKQIEAAGKIINDEAASDPEQYAKSYQYLKDNGYDVSVLDQMYGVYDETTGKYTSAQALTQRQQAEEQAIKDAQAQYEADSKAQKEADAKTEKNGSDSRAEALKWKEGFTQQQWRKANEETKLDKVNDLAMKYNLNDDQIEDLMEMFGL